MSRESVQPYNRIIISDVLPNVKNGHTVAGAIIWLEQMASITQFRLGDQLAIIEERPRIRGVFAATAG